MRLTILTALFVVGSAVVPAHAGETTIAIENFTFKPAEITVKTGTTVIFKNEDDIPHLVVAVDGSFRSKALDTQDQASLVLTKPGLFAYYCGLHPHMQGKIMVEP